MCVGSACAWKAYMGRSELHQGYQQTQIAAILKMSVCCIQSFMYLNLKFNSHLYIPGNMYLFCQLWSCLVPIGVGVLTLIRNHTSVPTDGVNTQHTHTCYYWPYLP